MEHDDLPKLKYTEAVLKETLRVYSPGLLLLRKIDKDLVLRKFFIPTLPFNTSMLPFAYLPGLLDTHISKYKNNCTRQLNMYNTN